MRIQMIGLTKRMMRLKKRRLILENNWSQKMNLPMIRKISLQNNLKISLQKKI